ncbi:hypothetical protein AGMMS50229_18970 [Campylobacterota bacterium]|nr:hypothetical protein AGMMS50229_18970 [Campylobacterota bacterium]
MRLKQLLLPALAAVMLCVSQGFAQINRIGMVVPHDLRVEYLKTPAGIDEPNPRFSWKLKSNIPGDAQTAYRIVVASTEKHSAGLASPVWDTQKVTDSNSVNIEYAGEPLLPGKSYTWYLTVYDQKEKPSATFSSTFTTGLFPTKDEPNPWKGKWIGYDAVPEQARIPELTKAVWIWDDQPGEGGSYPAGISAFRKNFEIPEDEILSAFLAFTADNSYKVFVNGNTVSEGTNFKSAGLADVAKFLKSGKNLIAVEAVNLGSNPNPAGLIGTLSVKFKNSPELVILTDASWKAVNGTPENWNFEVFDDSAWNNAVVLYPFAQGPWGEVNIAQPRPDIPARYLNKTFTADRKDAVRATVYISGLGYYELYLNEKRIGDHVLDPVYKDYGISVPYVTYEFDPKSVKGENKIQVILGNGRFYAPRRDEPMFTKDYGFPKLLFQMVLEYGDGSTQTIVSDETWKVTVDGPIQGNNDYDGEIYDARMENPATWNDVQIVEAPKGKLRSQNMPPMRVTEHIRPKNVTEVQPGVWVFDMGQNMVGWCRLKVRGPVGTQIQMKHAEALVTEEGPDKGMLYMANIRAAKVRDLYTCKGSGLEVYEPRFTYHGFRFVEVTGFPGRPNLDTITGCVVHTDLPFVGKFETSDSMINQIHKNIFWGTRGNYLSIPTDCPQRDERQGWQGDRAAESLGEMFLFDNVTLYSKWLQDIEESQTSEGNLSDVCPPFWPLYSPNVTWPSAFTIVPQSILYQYGDDRPIKRHYDAMVKWMKFLETHIHDGIIEVDNYGDWCVPPERKELIHSEDPARKTAKGILSTGYYIHNLDLLTKYAEMLGRTGEAEAHAAKAAEMKEAFNKKYYDPETGKYDNGTQTSCVLPLYFGIVPDGEREKVFTTLMNNIENVTDYHIGTGLIGGQWLNRILTEFGRADVSYKFATNEDYPSWGYMVKNGATTVWELWNGDTADPAMNSHNHVMLIGDLTIWFYQNLAGIKSEDGFRTIEMVPVSVGDLQFVNAEYDSIRGKVKSSWKRQNGKFQWTVTIPVGSTANVTVPADNPETVKMFGVNGRVINKGTNQFEVPSGAYTFVSDLK